MDSAERAISSRPVSSSRTHGKKHARTGASQSSPATDSENSSGAAPQQGTPQAPKIWLQGANKLTATFSGASNSATKGSAGTDATSLAQNNAVAMLLGAGQAQPLSMITGDFDQDGVEDLVVGYSTTMGPALALYRGNLDAFAPQSDASFQAIGRGEFPAPFLPQAQVISTPVTPDFIATGNFTGIGFQDVLIASRGGNALYLFRGDGKGNFAAPLSLSIPGNVTALATGEFGNQSQGIKVFVGTSDPTNGFAISVFSVTNGALSMLGSYPLNGAASSIEFGDFGDGGLDAVFISSGQIHILRSSLMQMQTIPFPFYATGLALGSFLTDRVPGLQMAILASDGTVQFAVHNEFDPRPYSAAEMKALLHTGSLRTASNPLIPGRNFPTNGWKIAESILLSAPVGQDLAPVLFRTRISSNIADDVMVINGSAGQMTVISHPNVIAGASTFAPAQESMRPYSGPAFAAIPARVNPDGRPGAIVLHQNDAAPYFMGPLPDPTFFVNRTDDPTPNATSGVNTCTNVSNADVSVSCSLREAVITANNTAGTDTIMLAAGTYTLTIPRNAADHSSSLTGTLEVQDSVNIIGAGQNTTIVQGGTLTNLSDSVDKVFSFNQDIDSFTSATVSISNFTIRNGHNRGNAFAIGDGFGGAFDFDTGSGGTATLTLTNMTITNNAVFDGQGGGFTIFNSGSGSGTATITNSIISNNNATPNGAGCCGDGGGIVIDARSQIFISNSQITGNHANSNAGTNANGGGLFLVGQHLQPQSAIHASTISGNTAAGTGGGIANTATLLIDQGTLISGNTAGNGGINGFGGGGIINNANDGLTINKATITGNTTTGNGGGIFTGNGSGGIAVTISFSRLAGNSSTLTPGSSNLFNFTGSAPGNHVTATNNWWGTNLPFGTISSATTICPAAAPDNDVCFDPFIVLTHTASPPSIRINQSSTLTGDMSLDNLGNGGALAGNLNVLLGLPITFNNAILGTIPEAQPEALNASAQATATFNAGGSGGLGSADATVDQQTVTATITILQPPSIIKSFNPTTVAVSVSSTLTFSVTNGNTATIDANFTDTLPAGLLVATPNGLTNTCGGTPTATAGSGSVSFTNPALAVGTCTITVNVKSAADGVKNNSVTINSTAAGNGNTSLAALTVINPPAIAKVFSASAIALNGTTSLTFTLTSTNANLTMTGVAFTDNLPSGLLVATPNNLNTTCSGVAAAVAGSSSASLTGSSLAPGASCTVSLNVTGTTSGVKNNSVQATSTNGGTGSISNASVTVMLPPVISKAFGAANIALNGTTTLTLTVTNPAANTVAETGVAFIDTLPTGLLVATPNGLSNTCNGAPSAVAGTTGISLVGGSIATPNTSCTVIVNVTGTASGQYTNTTGNVSSTNGGTGNTASANLTVAAPLTITKAFGAVSVPLNGTTSLTFNITNSNAGVTLTGIAFTDNLPAGLVVATPNGFASTCGGVATAVAGSSSVSLSAATLATNASCILSANVTGTVVGVKNNSVQATSTEGGPGNTSNASITVVSPPVIIKAFGAASIPLNGATSLTFTIQNNNTTTALTGTGFSDTLPAGLVVATPNGLSGACGSGTITATQATNVISLAGSTLAQSTSCTFAVNVKGTAAGVQNNTTGAVTSVEGGPGGTASASIAVVAPPSIAKAFGAVNISLNGTTSLTLTITNPAANTVAEAGVAVADALPAGLVVATPNGLLNTCGGAPVAVAGSGNISLTAGAVAIGSSCTLTVNVTGTVSGQFVNTTGTVSSTNGGTGLTAAANLTVATPPTIIKAFGAPSIPLNGTTSLTFNIQNPNAAVNLSGLAFTDNLPLGIVVATPNNLSSTCGGAVTAVAGSSAVTLAGGALPSTMSCTISVNVSGTTAGVKNNSVQVAATESGVGNTSNASITVVAPPVMIKAFGAASIPLNGATTLTFTIQNNNATSPLTGIGFSDTLPAGLVVATPNGLSGACGSGTITAAQATNVISLIGSTLAQSTSCTFAVNVKGTAAGAQNNTTGNLTSVEGGAGGTASASLAVVAPPTIAKAFGVPSIPLNGTTSLTLTITNPAANTVAEAGVAFADALPAGIVVATPNGLLNTCGGAPVAVAGSGNISLTAGAVAIGSSCTLTVNVTGTALGQLVNTTGTVSSTNGGTGITATANLTVAAPPVIAKSFNPTSIALNANTTLSFTITNPAANNIPLTGIAFTDNLPAGLIVATPNGLSGTCGGGAISAVAGSSIVSLAPATLAQNTSCTFSINATGTTAGVKNNSVQVTANESGVGNTSNATVAVVAPPTIIKVFGAATIPLNGATTLSFTIQNNNATTTVTGIGFSDTLPAGLVVATPNGIVGTCGGGTITATQATSVISLSGATLAPTVSCTFSVNVTGTTAGAKNNTTGNIASVEGGTGGTASASIAVVAPPSITKAFNPNSIGLNTNSTLTFTITNPAANTVAEAGVGFTDTFPVGIVIATPNGLTNTCGGVVTATAGSGSVTLAAGTIASSTSCTIAVTTTGTARGNFTNTSGAVSSTNGGTGNTASAAIVVVTPDLTITKSHAGNFLLGQIGASYTLTVNNIGLDPTFGTVTAADVLPVGLTATAISGSGWTCILGTLTCTRSDVLAAGGSYPAITVTVNVAANAANSVTNNASVSGGGEANLANDTAADVTIISTFTITSVPSTATIRAGQAAVFTLTITPVGGAVTVPITFTDVTTALKTTLTFVPTQVTPGASPATVVLTVQTTAGLGFVGQKTGTSAAPLAAILFPMGLVVLAGIGAGKYRKNKKFTGWIALVLVVSFFGMGLMGCAGNQQNFQNLGTPPGTYPVTVTGSAGGTLQNLNLTLIVQP
jgi:hypothetical protein